MKKKKGGMYNFLSTNVVSKEKQSDNVPCNISEDPEVLELLNQMNQSYAENDNSMSMGSGFAFGSNNFATTSANNATNENSGMTLSWPAASPFEEPLIETKPVTLENSLKRPATTQLSDASAPKALKMDVDVKEEIKKPAPSEELGIPVKNQDNDLNENLDAEPVAAKDLFAEQNFYQFDDDFEADTLNEDEQTEKGENEQSIDDKTLRMYWIETFEDVYKNPGFVYLFGKLDGKSCCVIVKNIEHKVYFLPTNTDEDVKKSMSEVHSEVQDKFLNNKFFHTSDPKDRVLRTKPEKIKWIPTDQQTPREVTALMVLYKGHLPKIAPNTKGVSFSHVLNTTATAMERLLLEAKLRGPCWIDIKNAVESKRKSSHCDLEYVVDMRTAGQHNIKTADVKKPSPFVNLVALNIVGVPTSDGRETEIIMISGLYRNKGLLDRANNSNQNAYKTFCFVTHPKNGIMPLTFDAELKRLNLASDAVNKTPNERALLNLFFAKIKQFDPDIIIAHDASAQISFLMSRAEKYNVKTWSFISRLERNQAPSRLCKTKAGQWELMAGRSVLCSKTAAEELYPTRSYELGDLVALLMPNANRISLSHLQIIEPFTNPKSKLLTSQLIQWSWCEAYYALQLVLQLNALPLFIQITQIVGGVLSRTLLGGRSERNEYLLLHAFYESGYIPPDKHQFGGFKKGNKALKEETNGDEEETKGTTSRKAQYTGGLVLEPKKGFYDTYIVLLDFNSLYPSIIQEFNICFTTIDRCYEEPDEKGLPEPPKDSVSEGILSIEIGNLVRNRREVKNQMQKTRPGTDEYLRLDVRQKGLKLTANSMYGCLGFGMSRFCAKTLAAMITSKGRELLSRTKDMVEKRGYTVVYGDTDSIMVNTNTNVYNDACRLAYDLRKIVNGGFKHVEMDVDGLFKRLLLLKKKKYAALTVSLKSETNVKKEMKGLDIVRRDWSKLAKDVGERVVDLILNSKEREDLIPDVVSTLTELAENLKENKLPLEDFEILKQLTKPPSEYVDAKNQPHVLVAMRLNASKTSNIRQGDVVKYVICQDGTNNSAVQRAYHLSELASNENLAIDTHYYLSQQVHPVVMRLCEPFKELDSSRIAESLGLDPSGYRGHHASSSTQTADFMSFELPTDAFADFDLCEGFKFECPECKKPVIIRSTLQGQGLNVYFALESCPECHCKLVSYVDNLKSSLIIQLNSYIKKYSEAKYVCDDQTCAYQENDISELVWTSSQGPLCPQCKSTFMRKTFSLRDLFYQQKFFKSIFDRETHLAKHCTPDQRKGPLNASKIENKRVSEIYDDFKRLTLEHMESNRYNKVDLGRILSNFKRLF